MRADLSSQSAELMAMYRAAHQVLDAPAIFDDPFALALTDPRFARTLQADPEVGRCLLAAGRRAFLAARSRYAEDRLAHAVGQGCEQYVVLGAGFDTFCLRCRESGLRIFEIDHPSTQATKLARLRDAGLGMPARTSFHPADFTGRSLNEILLEAGVDPRRRVFVSWLGVTQYLSREVVGAALEDMASFSPLVEIVFDYTIHYDQQNATQRSIFDTARGVAEKAGEPFRSMFAPEEIAGLCRSAGFSEVATTSLAQLNALYAEQGGPSIAEGINHLAYARAESQLPGELPASLTPGTLAG